MTPASALLTRIVAVGDIVLNHPGAADHEKLHALMAELVARHEKPSEHRRRTHFAKLFLDALDHVMWERRDRKSDAEAWARIATAALPAVQADILRALEDERDQLTETR